MKTKQVIVIRKDLNMRKGKLAAQCCHASMKGILHNLDILIEDSEGTSYHFSLPNKKSIKDWLFGVFTKIVVSCVSEEELLELKAKADNMDIINAIIQDAGKTEFHGVPTYTALAIGPDESEKIDEITGHLPLL